MAEPRRSRPEHAVGNELADAVQALRENGGRLTQAKRAMLQVLHDASAPLTADEVHGLLPEIDAATVYRTLAQFEAAGIVHHRHLAHGPASYRWAGVETMPIVCQGCGLVVELGASEFRALAKRAKERHGMTLLPGHFALTGWCEQCTIKGD